MNETHRAPDGFPAAPPTTVEDAACDTRWLSCNVSDGSGMARRAFWFDSVFGELGNTNGLSTRGEHFAGPVAKYEIEHLGKGELGIEAGYKFALGSARKLADGQLRVLLKYEIKC